MALVVAPEACLPAAYLLEVVAPMLEQAANGGPTVVGQVEESHQETDGEEGADSLISAATSTTRFLHNATRGCWLGLKLKLGWSCRHPEDSEAVS